MSLPGGDNVGKTKDPAGLRPATRQGCGHRCLAREEHALPMADGFGTPVAAKDSGALDRDGEEGWSGRVQPSPGIDDAAFTRFYSTHVEQVRTFLLRRGLRADEADDLVQDVFVRAYRAFGLFAGRGIPEAETAWIRKIALHLWYNRHRSRKPTVSLDELDTTSSGGFQPFDPDALLADEEAQRKELLAEIPKAVEGLPDGQRSVLELWLDGQTYDDICRSTGKGLQNVRATLHKAKEKVGERIRGLRRLPFGGRAG